MPNIRPASDGPQLAILPIPKATIVIGSASETAALISETGYREIQKEEPR